MTSDNAKDAAKELARPAQQCRSAATAASYACARWRYVESGQNAICFLGGGRHRKGAI
jgi:hypothetical protein